MLKRPPVYLKKWKLFHDEPEFYRKWTCDGRFQSAEFQDRHDPKSFVIVHRSTKTPGKWQTSRFDAQGAESDSQASSCQEALKEISPRLYKLKSFTPKVR